VPDGEKKTFRRIGTFFPQLTMAQSVRRRRNSTAELLIFKKLPAPETELFY
jgi:hypothetical protein